MQVVIRLGLAITVRQIGEDLQNANSLQSVLVSLCQRVELLCNRGLPSSYISM